GEGPRDFSSRSRAHLSDLSCGDRAAGRVRRRLGAVITRLPRMGRSKVRPYLAVLLALGALFTASIRAQSDVPQLTQPVNDFAHVIDEANRADIDRMIRTLKAATGDIVVVATVPTIASSSDINEYAVKLFENHGRGIGDKGKDNGVLIV